MKDEPCPHPDLLRRYVLTPYIFTKYDRPNRLVVESNDLEIALSLHRSNVIHQHSTEPNGLLCKVIRDMAGPVDGSDMTIISNGAVRVLHLGQGTILIHDRERSELLGFIARDVRAQELVLLLLPALLDG
jgi:hypothetical protein